MSFSQICTLAASCIASADMLRRQERIDAATRAHQALDLLLTTLEVAADGGAGVSDGFAPALLDALCSVQTQPFERFELLKPLHQDVPEEEWVVRVVKGDE